MDQQKTPTIGFAVLDKYGTPCTEDGVRTFKARIDERFPEEAGNDAMAVMGQTANEPTALAAMLKNGTCRHVFVRVGGDVHRLGPESIEAFAEGLLDAPEGATSWEVAVRSMGLDPETEE